MNGYKGQIIKIPLGIEIWESDEGEIEEVCMTSRSWGVYLLIAKSRFGKTTLAKNVTSHLASEGRRILIFDCYQDYTHINNPNYNFPMGTVPRYVKGVPNLKIIKNFTLPISDFNNPADWISLGFSFDYGAGLCSIIASRIGLHNDDPDQFEAILSRLPRTDEELPMFNNLYSDYGLKLSGRIPEPAINAIRNRYSFVKNWFWDPKNDDRLVVDWKEELLNHNLVVDLNLFRDENVSKIRAFVGCILRQIKPILPRVKPFIIVEEADKIAPNIDLGSVYYYPSSLSHLIEYTYKLQRWGVSLLFISQDEKLMSQEIAKGFHQKILGALAPDAKDFQLTQGLRWDPEKNVRQFLILNENNQYTKFKPYWPFCE